MERGIGPGDIHIDTLGLGQWLGYLMPSGGGRFLVVTSVRFSYLGMEIGGLSSHDVGLKMGFCYCSWLDENFYLFQMRRCLNESSLLPYFLPKNIAVSKTLIRYSSIDETITKIFVNTCRKTHASGVGAYITRYDTLVSLLVPVEDAVFGLGGAPCTIRFRMVVIGLLIPLSLK